MVEHSAYASAQRFRHQVRDLGGRLRALPAEVKKTTKTRGRDLVAAPMVDLVVDAARSTRFAPKVAADVRAVAGTTPTIKLTGTRKRFSGGASTRDVVPGALWGNGGRSSRSIPATARRRGYRPRTTTAQFRGPGHDFAFTPIASQQGRLLEAWGRILDEALEEVDLG